MKILVIGELIADLLPTAPSPGDALDLTATPVLPGGVGRTAVAARQPDVDVTLVTAGSDTDAEFSTVVRYMESQGVNVLCANSDARLPWRVWPPEPLTPIEHYNHKRNPTVNGSPLQNIDIASYDAIAVSDYGLGILPQLLRDVSGHIANHPIVVWDPHPQGIPLPELPPCIICPNIAEAIHFGGGDVLHDRPTISNLFTIAESLQQQHASQGVVVTLGEVGSLYYGPDEGRIASIILDSPALPGHDLIGAGDAYTALLTISLVANKRTIDALDSATRSTVQYLAENSELHPARQAQLIMGTKEVHVATGGCFDLLHEGHIRLLQQARLLGTRLTVLLNSDDSVRRLKGDSRPIASEDYRRSTLQALPFVDDVICFHEDTPVEALMQLKPDLFVKGGDYTTTILVETIPLESTGGMTVVIPHTGTRSTTQMLEQGGSDVADDQ